MTRTSPLFVLGNALNPVAPTGLAPRAPISLPTLDFPCLAPLASLLAQTDPLPSAASNQRSPPIHFNRPRRLGTPLAQMCL